jgi:hypothetical protein
MQAAKAAPAASASVGEVRADISIYRGRFSERSFDWMVIATSRRERKRYAVSPPHLPK